MKGDFPGLSKRWPGAIGSCQYNTFLPVAGSTSPAFNASPAGFAAIGAGAECHLHAPVHSQRIQRVTGSSEEARRDQQSPSFSGSLRCPSRRHTVNAAAVRNQKPSCAHSRKRLRARAGSGRCGYRFSPRRASRTALSEPLPPRYAAIAASRALAGKWKQRVLVPDQALAIALPLREHRRRLRRHAPASRPRGWRAAHPPARAWRRARDPCRLGRSHCRGTDTFSDTMFEYRPALAVHQLDVPVGFAIRLRHLHFGARHLLLFRQTLICGWWASCPSRSAASGEPRSSTAAPPAAVALRAPPSAPAGWWRSRSDGRPARCADHREAGPRREHIRLRSTCSAIGDTALSTCSRVSSRWPINVSRSRS